MLQRAVYGIVGCWQLKRRLAWVVNYRYPRRSPNDPTAIWKGIVWFGRYRSDWIRALAFVQAIKDPETKARTSKVWHSASATQSTA